MKITVSKNEIQEKLSNIQNIVEKRNTMPILSHFLLDAGKAGSSIVATDLETALKEPIQVTVEKEGKICIPARKMFEIVREIEGNLLCETIDDQWLKIKAGASTFRLACLSAKEFPAWPGMDDVAEISLEPKVLSSAIEKTVFAAGESDTRYTLNGVLFHITAKRMLTVVGTDGHRLAMIRRPFDGTAEEDRKLIVPRKAAVELRKLLEKAENPVKAALSKNHILFSVNGLQFLTRLIEGTYPNYEQVVPSGNEKKVAVQRDAFGKILRRVAIMSKEGTKAVKVDLESGRMAVTSSNPDMGEAHDELPVEYTGEKLTLGFNARYLIDSLEAITSEQVTMEMQAALSPVLIRDEKDADYLCVIMPMRI